MIVLISAPNFSFIRWTTGSCSALPRPLPLLDAAFTGATWALPPGTICNFIARPNAPLATAIIVLLESALTDISIRVAEAATVINTSLPCNFHSPISSMEQSIDWPADVSAFRTVDRTSSIPADCDSIFIAGAGCAAAAGAGCAATAGAAAPITTGVVLTAAGVERDGVPASGVASDRGVPFRAESAAKGDTKGREGTTGSDFLVCSGAM